MYYQYARCIYLHQPLQTSSQSTNSYKAYLIVSIVFVHSFSTQTDALILTSRNTSPCEIHVSVNYTFLASQQITFFSAMLQQNPATQITIERRYFA